MTCIGNILHMNEECTTKVAYGCSRYTFDSCEHWYNNSDFLIEVAKVTSPAIATSMLTILAIWYCTKY